MAKRPRPRRPYSLESRLHRIIASDSSLAAPGSSTEDGPRHPLPPPRVPPTSKRPDPDASNRQPAVESEVPADDAAAGGGGHNLARGGGGKASMFADLGGMQPVINLLMKDVVIPLRRPELLQWLGGAARHRDPPVVRPVPGILLRGRPGCGKTTLAHAIANETGVPFHKTSAPELVSGVWGASEENIRSLFNKAYRTAPSIVFIDEIDAIASKREDAQRGMEQRIVTQLMTCMDQFHQNFAGSDGAASDMDTSQSSDVEKTKTAEGHVVGIGATNRPDAVNPALRRPGRFDREICLGVPDEDARRQILERLTRSLRKPVEGGPFDLDKITRAAPGFVGSDLKALVDQAGSQAIDRFIDEATKVAQPSLRREGFSSIPDVKWADVGGLDSLKQELDRCIVRCIKHPELYKKFGVDMQDSFLLFGPPGCGKTLIAKEVAHDAGANFIYKKGPELLTKYVGESESGVRKIFARARTNSPCIIFFDEIDALTTKRGNEGSWVVERVVNQLLTELGSSSDQGVFVIAATNRIDVIDDALLRPGRFGRKRFVPLPGANERASILKLLAGSGKKPLSPSVDLDALARREECNNLSGANLASLMNEAATEALEDRLGSGLGESIELSHFERALSKVKP
uniref:AAA+ ATPase domain-containing protein n=1 Tax=Aegilops tauschii TaxID=37682 RepID=M8CS12_AEGTA